MTDVACPHGSSWAGDHPRSAGWAVQGRTLARRTKRDSGSI